MALKLKLLVIELKIRRHVLYQAAALMKTNAYSNLIQSEQTVLRLAERPTSPADAKTRREFVLMICRHINMKMNGGSEENLFDNGVTK